MQKCFNVEKLSFLKRNDRNSNTSALRTHLLQVELYRDKLQVRQTSITPQSVLYSPQLFISSFISSIISSRIPPPSLCTSYLHHSLLSIILSHLCHPFIILPSFCLFLYHPSIILSLLHHPFIVLSPLYHPSTIMSLLYHLSIIPCSPLSLHHWTGEETIFEEVFLLPQAFQGRLSELTSQLGSDTQEGCLTKVTEDAVNQLQRQMCENERSIEDHLFTLHATHTLLLRMEEVSLSACLFLCLLSLYLAHCCWFDTLFVLILVC